MNDAVRSIPAQTQSLKANQMMIIGRLDRVTKYNDRFDHIFTLPAPDEYHKPSVVRVNASRELGEVDTTVKCLVEFQGWPNNYKVTNDEGKTRQIYDVRGFFSAVE